MAAMAGLSLDSRVGHKMAPRSPCGGGDNPKRLGKSLSPGVKPVVELEEGEEPRTAKTNTAYGHHCHRLQLQPVDPARSGRRPPRMTTRTM
jgi:hypothetical protein